MPSKWQQSASTHIYFWPRDSNGYLVRTRTYYDSIDGWKDVSLYCVCHIHSLMMTKESTIDIEQLWCELSNPETANFKSLMQADYVSNRLPFIVRVKFSNNSKSFYTRVQNFSTFDCINFSSQNHHLHPPTKSKCTLRKLFPYIESVQAIKHIWLMHCMWNQTHLITIFCPNWKSNQIKSNRIECEYDGKSLLDLFPILWLVCWISDVHKSNEISNYQHVCWE